MRRRPARTNKAIKVVELASVDVAGELGTGETLPVHAITLSVDGNRRGLAFTVTRRSWSAMDDVAKRALAQTLGALVAPFPCTLVVVEEHADLRAFEITGG